MLTRATECVRNHLIFYYIYIYIYTHTHTHIYIYIHSKHSKLKLKAKISEFSASHGGRPATVSHTRCPSRGPAHGAGRLLEARSVLCGPAPQTSAH